MEKVPFGKFGFINKNTLNWFTSHITSIAGIAVLALIAGLWSIYQWNSGSPKDYLAAEAVFNEWKGDCNHHLAQLQKILKQHPELHAKYDGRIAQKLLLNSQQGLATLFSKATLKRVGGFSPYHTQFSNCSLLIGEKKFQEALAQSKQLKQSLDQDEKFWETKSVLIQHGNMLYGYNLLRIAFLEQVMGNVEGELKAWEEFKQRAGWVETATPYTRSNTAAYQLINQNFQRNDVSLEDFIKYRESLLKN